MPPVKSRPHQYSQKTLSDILFYLVIVFYTQITFNHNQLTLQSGHNITEVVYETGP